MIRSGPRGRRCSSMPPFVHKPGGFPRQSVKRPEPAPVSISGASPAHPSSNRSLAADLEQQDKPFAAEGPRSRSGDLASPQSRSRRDSHHHSKIGGTNYTRQLRPAPPPSPRRCPYGCVIIDVTPDPTPCSAGLWCPNCDSLEQQEGAEGGRVGGWEGGSVGPAPCDQLLRCTVEWQYAFPGSAGIRI